MFFIMNINGYVIYSVVTVTIKKTKKKNIFFILEKTTDASVAEWSKASDLSSDPRK